MGKPPKTIIYNGVKYSINRGYYKTTYALHRKVWEDHFGEIPSDHHVHHKNGDSLDNRIENLECIHKKTHHSMHFSAIRQLEKMQSPEARAKRKATGNLPTTRKKFSRASKKGWGKRKPVGGYCHLCHLGFYTKNFSGTKYCSPLCRSRAAALRKTYKKNCVFCGEEFLSVAAKTCSQKCKGLLISQTKRGLSYDPLPKSVG